MPKPTTGLAAFAAFCKSLTVEDGSAFKLHAFERTMLADYFAGVSETVIVIPKKNGKSTMLAALALFHLVTTPNAVCAIAAASRDQAMWIFDQARGFVQRSEALQAQVRVLRGYREIRRVRPGATSVSDLYGLVKVFAADEDKVDGVIPTLALVDELHRHKTAGMYGTLRDGLDPNRAGQMITISTAGARADSPLGELRIKAHAMEGLTRKGAYRHALSADGAFAWHEWALDPDADVSDMRTVKDANPAPWQTLASLARRHDSPSTTPWQWLRFACGIWTEGEEPWITPESWDALMSPSAVIDPGSDVWVGVDVGVRHDTTGIVTLGRRGKGFVIAARILRPPGGEKALPLATIEESVREVARAYRVRAIGYDPWSFRRSAEILEDDGLPMVAVPQSPETMSIASATLYRLITERLLAHDGDTALRAQVLAGITKQTERGWRLQKDSQGRRPIDALIALAIASHVANTETESAVPAFVAL